MTQPTIVLVPGFWLGGWAWDSVAAELRGAGHPVIAATLPGLDPADTGRASVRWTDQVDALARIVAEAGPRPEPDPDVPAELGELPLPSWSELERDGNSLAGLSPEQLATFAARAVPEPAGIPRGPVVLSNEARRAVPTTVVCCSMPSAQIRQLVADGHPWGAELAAMSAVSYVDLPTGHWPMWSKPAELATVLLEAAAE